MFEQPNQRMSEEEKEIEIIGLRQNKGEDERITTEVDDDQ